MISIVIKNQFILWFILVFNRVGNFKNVYWNNINEEEKKNLINFPTIELLVLCVYFYSYIHLAWLVLSVLFVAMKMKNLFVFTFCGMFMLNAYCLWFYVSYTLFFFYEWIETGTRLNHSQWKTKEYR